MKPELREKIIEKLLMEEDNESLFNKLCLDLDEVFRNELEKKSDDELLEMIL